jgi:hypothetical protein
LVRLGGAGLVRVKWTDQIHAEWIGNLLQNRPELERERLERTRDLMTAHIFDSLVTGYESLIPGIELPDPNDRHVVAAAIRGRASVIATLNLKDFPAATLLPYGLEALHPDSFVERLLDLDIETVCDSIRKQRADLSKPKVSAEVLLDTLRDHGLEQTVRRLRPYVEQL